MRRLLLILPAVFLLYILVGSAILAGIGAASLRVGPLNAMIARQGPSPDPFALAYRGTPMEALGLDYETLAIPAELGPAEAWWIPAEERGIAAIYVHGIAGARENGYRHLRLLADAGIPVLLITYRNDAGAPAAPEGHYLFGQTEWRDLEAAVAFLETRGTERVVLVGESMGGAIIGQFLRHSALASRVRAVALDAPAVDFAAVMTQIGRAMRLPLPALLGPVSARMIGLVTPLDAGAANVVADLAAYPGPLFLAQGDGDRIVPASGAEALLRARHGTTHFLRGGADHLLTFAEDPGRYRRAFSGFLALARD